MSKPPRLALKTTNGEWSLSLYRAVWLGYGVPVTLGLLGYYFGVEGFVMGALIALLSFRGKL